MRSSQFPTMGETGKHYYNELRVSPTKTVPLVQCGCKLGANSPFTLLLVPLDTITWRAKQVSEFNNWEDILEFGIQILKLHAQCSFWFCDHTGGKHLPLEKPSLNSPHLKKSRVATCKTFLVHSWLSRVHYFAFFKYLGHFETIPNNARCFNSSVTSLFDASRQKLCSIY